MQLLLFVVVCYDLLHASVSPPQDTFAELDTSIKQADATNFIKKKPLFASYESYIDELSDETGFMAGLEALLQQEADEVFSIPSSPTTASLLDTYGIDDTPPSQKKYNAYIPPSPPIQELITDFLAQYYLLLVGVTSLSIAVLFSLCFIVLHYSYAHITHTHPLALSPYAHDLERLIASLEKSSVRVHFYFHPVLLAHYLAHINTIWDSSLTTAPISDMFNYCDRLHSLQRGVAAEVHKDTTDMDLLLVRRQRHHLVTCMEKQLVHVKWAVGIHYTLAERLAECAARQETTLDQLHAITAKCSQMTDLHIPIDGGALLVYRKCDLYLKKIGNLLCDSEAYRICLQKISAHYDQRVLERSVALQTPLTLLSSRDATARLSYPVKYDVRQEVAVAVAQVPRMDVVGSVAEEERHAARDARRSADEVLRQWRNEHVEHVRSTENISNSDDKRTEELKTERTKRKIRQKRWITPYHLLLALCLVSIMYTHSSCFGRLAVNPLSDPGQWLMLQMSYFCAYLNTSCGDIVPQTRNITSASSLHLPYIFVVLSHALWDAFAALCSAVSLNADALYSTFLPCAYNMCGMLITQLILRWITRKMSIQNGLFDSLFLGWSLYSLRVPVLMYLSSSFPSATPLLFLILSHYSLCWFDNDSLTWGIYVPSSVRAETFSLKYMKYFSGINIRSVTLYVVLPLLVVGWSCVVTYYYPLQCV